MTRRTTTLTIVLAAAMAASAQAQSEWNRRVRSIVPQPTAGAPDSFFDIHIDWAIDLSGATSAPSELGVEVELQINGVPIATQTSEDCLIWDIQPPTGTATCNTTAETCGTLIHNGETDMALVDAPFGTCGVRPESVVFPAVELQPKDEIMVLLRPAPGTLPV